MNRQDGGSIGDMNLWYIRINHSIIAFIATHISLFDWSRNRTTGVVLEPSFL